MRAWRWARASGGRREHSEAATDPRGSLQPEPDPAHVAGSGNPAGVEESPGRACLARLVAVQPPEMASEKLYRRFPGKMLFQTALPLANEIQLLPPRAAKVVPDRWFTTDHEIDRGC